MSQLKKDDRVKVVIGKEHNEKQTNKIGIVVAVVRKAVTVSFDGVTDRQAFLESELRKQH